VGNVSGPDGVGGLMGSSEREWTEGGFITREQATTVIRNIGRQYGYAIAHHGTGIRDVDLVAVPWQEKVATPEFLISEVEEALNGIRTGPPELKPHGRLSWAIQLAAVGPPDIWYVDLAVVVPVVERGPEELREELEAQLETLDDERPGVIPPTSRAGDEPMYAWLLELLRDRFSGLPAGLQKAIAWEICGAVKERFGERALLFPYSFHGLTRAEIDPQDDSK
jgi:hypothetical protein